MIINYRDPEHTLVIAEVGSNHVGDPGLAREAVAAAKEAGADVVKYQMYRAEELVDASMPVLKYIAQTHKTQRERFESLQLDPKIFEDLARAAADAGIGYMVTPFFIDAVPFLDKLVPAFKIASGDLTNPLLLDAVAATGKPVFLSTGLSSLEEVDWAVARLPKAQLHLMHCVGAYPTPDEQVNLATIGFFRARYGVPVGYSDHSAGITAPVASVALGARSVEKHFMPDLDAPVADTALSVGVDAFRRMVDEIRRVETMRGTPDKVCQADEAYFKTTLRRSIYARADIAAGQPIDAKALIPLRPWLPDAVSPMEIEHLVGRLSRRNIAAGEPILTADVAETE